MDCLIQWICEHKTEKSVTEYYVEENNYDDNGDWISGGDIYGFSTL